MGAVLDDTNGPLLVMEFMELGSLYDLLHNDSVALEGELLLPILGDVAQGMRYDSCDKHMYTPPSTNGF
jgi:guanylate cyclase